MSVKDQNTMTLKVNTGSMLVKLEDERGEYIGEFVFSPTDTDIVSRYKEVTKYFSGFEVPEEPSLEWLQEKSAEIREQVDLLFARKVSDGIFNACGPFTVLANGDFYIEDVLGKIADLIGQVFNKRVDEKIKKIRRATSKYTS